MGDTEGLFEGEEISLLNLSAFDIAVERAMCQKSFYYFMQYFWSTIIAEEPVYNWHMEFVCQELQKIGERVINRQPSPHDTIINIPPGSTKSTMATIMFPVWCWTNDASLKVISASYSSPLAKDHSGKSRDIIKSDEFIQLFPDVAIRVDEDSKGKYATHQGGLRYATSIGGTVTGIHAHIKIVDDPLNPKKASSETERKTANDWYDQTLSTRSIDKKITPTITIMQRLHEDDCTGHLLEQDETTMHICLPSEDSVHVRPETCRKKYVDGLLDPIRMDKEVLAKERTKLGGTGFAGQHEQLPQPDEGGMIKKTWFKKILLNVLIARAAAIEVQLIWHFAVDSAYTESKKNDPSAIFCWCMFENQMYIRKVEARWLEFPELVKWLPEFVLANGYDARLSKIYIEPKASGLSLAQMLKKKTLLNIIIDKSPKISKEQRVAEVTPFLESGRATLIEGAWNEGYLHELGSFPNGKQDDQVDTTVIGVNKVDRRKSVAFA